MRHSPMAGGGGDEMENEAKCYQFSKEYTRGNISVNISLRASEDDTANDVLGEFVRLSHAFYLDMAQDMTAADGAQQPE